MLANPIYIKMIKKKKKHTFYIQYINASQFNIHQNDKGKKRSHCTPKEKREGKLKKKS